MTSVSTGSEGFARGRASRPVPDRQGALRRSGRGPVTRRGLWVFWLAAVGFAIPGLFATSLGLGRNAFVLVYALIGGAVLAAFLRLPSVGFRDHLRRNQRPGALAGLALGALLAVTVMRQPGSDAPGGIHLAMALAWLGLVYGLLDGLLLTVAPVLAIFGADTPSLSRRAGGWRRGALGLVASLVVTAAYHLGYREFRGPNVVQPLVGNAVLTAGYLLTGSIATPVIGHVIMHSSAVLHGMETTSQLPPHHR